MYGNSFWELPFQSKFLQQLMAESDTNVLYLAEFFQETRIHIVC